MRAPKLFAASRALGLAAVATIFAGAAVVSCAPSDFDPITLVNSVRMLASRSSKPYAKPGDTVDLEVLAYDGRPDRTRAMHVYWFPFACVNPAQDAYYGCFASFAQSAKGGDGGLIGISGSGADAGADGGDDAGAPPVPTGDLTGLLKPGVDISPFLHEGSTYHVTLPKDVVSSHPKVPGADAPYGLVMVFNMACAGHIELVERDPGNPQSVPFACFDDAHTRLGPTDYVLGFTRVYAYDDRVNANPTISGATFDDKPIDLTAGITVDHCTTADKKDCPKISIDVQVPPESQEPNPGDVDPSGAQLKEEVWAAYYSTGGRFDDDIRILYEPRVGKVDGTATKFQAPQQPGDGMVWIVVHDNRSGATWLPIPLHAR